MNSDELVITERSTYFLKSEENVKSYSRTLRATLGILLQLLHREAEKRN